LKPRAVSLFFLVVLFVRSISLPAAEVESPFKQGEELLDAGRITQAEELAAKSLRENSRSGPALAFDGRVKFYQGRYPEALASLEKSLAVDSQDQRAQGWKLLTQLTLDVVKTLKRFESPHFALYLDEKRDGILAPYALETLEKSYEAIGAALGYYPKEKVRVEIASDAPSFNAISTLSLRDIEETGAVGICKFNKLMIISPRALSFGYRWLDSVSHEYVHYVIVNISNHQARIWLFNGTARS